MAGDSVFQWGDSVAGSLSSYEFMFFKGVRYALHDCVFVRSGLSEPNLGKLMRLYDERGVKKVRIRWFFRHEELPFSVRKDFPPGKVGKEVFIAQGNMKGVENENLVEVLLGKATVLCTAKCRDNPVPSELHMNSAHHVFNRVYDVCNKKLLKMDKIEKSLARKLFNKPEWLEAAQNVPRDGCLSPTSVRDFDMVAKQLPLVQKPSLKLKVKRPSMEPLRPPLAVKRPSMEPLRPPLAVKSPSMEPLRPPLAVKSPSMEPLRPLLAVKRPSMEPLRPPLAVKRPSVEPRRPPLAVKTSSLESAKNQFKSTQQVPKHAVVVLRRDVQSQDEIIDLD